MFILENNDDLKEKFRKVFKKFVYPTGEIYGASKGLYDYGMNGCEIMDNIVSQWKNFFVTNDDMLKIECSMLTPEKVLQASGHVQKFNDFMVNDLVTGENYRADHLIENYLEQYIKQESLTEDRIKEVKNIIQQIDNFGEKELSDLIIQFDIKSQDNNPISSPRPFNLMFSTFIGPSGIEKAYLRPETAQGIFINFKRLLEEKQGKLPFAVAQIGSSFRNEIAPRQGLLRVREFKMAEIEHFLDPIDKSHRKFASVAHLNIQMFPSHDQMSKKSMYLMNLGEAVSKKLVNNETLGYFIGRIYLFLTKIGIKHELLRFRQHMPNEMAHYASDCWDAECLTSYGWIECVGCADRSCYDLERHGECSGIKLVAQRQLETPKLVKRSYCKPNMAIIGKTFKKNSSVITKYIQSLSSEDAKKLLEKDSTVDIEGSQYVITTSMGDMVEEDLMVNTEEFVPSVIEPSFGLGRIFYSLMEQNFDMRDNDENRTYFRIPANIASYKFSILPLSSNDAFVPLTESISSLLKERNIMVYIDTSSASIGKRYARTDLIGVPFGITIDFDSVNIVPASVTVRDRDSMSQIRVNVEDISKLAVSLIFGGLNWADVSKQYPIFEGQINK